MQSRKKQNLEVERKIKRQKKIYAAVFAAICMAVVIVIGWVVWDTQNRRFIMTFNGERIATSDFRFMSVLSQMPINEFTRDDILHELMTFLTVMQMGEYYQLGFTGEELEEIETNAAFFREIMEQGGSPGMLGFIDDRRMGEFLGLFEFVGARLIDYLITDYEVDEEQFEAELEWHIETLIREGSEVFVKYMALDPAADNIDAAIELSAINGIDFDDIASRFCVLGTGLEPIDINDFAANYGVHIDEWFAGLPVGQHSSILHGTDYSFYFYVYDRIEPELVLEEVEREFRDRFELELRQGIFFERLEGWVAEAEFELNHRVFDTIS